MKIQQSILCLALIAATSSVAWAAKPATTDTKQMAISGKAVKQALKDLRMSADEYKDSKGNPHFVIKDKVSGAKTVAIYMADCKSARCEDVTFYADFGSVPKLKPVTLNEWNHIGSKLRSKAFRSGGVDNAEGNIGLSSTVSYLGDSEYKKLAMQLGLFVAEVNMMRATIDKL